MAVSEWREGSQTARLQFDPQPDQLQLDGGLSGQLIVQYDVKRALDAGDVQVRSVRQRYVCRLREDCCNHGRKMFERIAILECDLH